MAEYRRFVAYVYEYRRGKKGSNCGFVRVEEKNRRCLMELHLQCPGLTADIPCKVYGFVRKDGLLNGIYLGECRTGENRVECVLESEAQNMGNSGVSLEKMGGMIFCTELGAFFGTEWDDRPIRPENFKAYEVPAGSPKTLREETGEAKGDKDLKEEPKVPEEQQKESEEPEAFEEQEESAESEATGGMQEAEASESPEGQEEPAEASEMPEGQQEGLEEPEESREDREEAGTPEEQTVSEVEAEEVVRENRQETPPEPDRTAGWTPGEVCMPFSDGEMVQCWKIHPRDVCRMFRRDGSLRNNRFLLHGYYNFGHLLLCRRGDGRCILGVPGGYDQQERFMANMFGFPYFKESRQVELAQSRGGYWYRFMEEPRREFVSDRN